MPLYEYECESCQTRVEKIQKFSDPHLATCEKCGGTMRKLVSSPAIQFKGSGWYITDYAKKSSAPESSKGDSKGTESKTKDGGGGGGDSAKADTPAASTTASETKSST